jgi:hypothetical protein
MPTAHRLSFPTCISHLRRIHLHCHKVVLWLLTSHALGFSNRLDWKSQISIATTGPIPGVITSSTQSLTWRELLTGLATCSCDQFHHSEDTTTRISNAQSMETTSHGEDSATTIAHWDSTTRPRQIWVSQSCNTEWTHGYGFGIA